MFLPFCRLVAPDKLIFARRGYPLVQRPPALPEFSQRVLRGGLLGNHTENCLVFALLVLGLACATVCPPPPPFFCINFFSSSSLGPIAPNCFVASARDCCPCLLVRHNRFLLFP